MRVFDTELFIREVEREEFLWNTNAKEYNAVGRYVKFKAWTNIASTMHGEWQNLNKEEQDLKTEELKKKWKHLRDNYARDVNETRKNPKGSDAKNAKKNAYSDLLSFLQPVVKKRKIFGKTETPSCSTNNNIYTDENFDGELSNQVDEPVLGEEDVSTPKQQRKKKEQITSFQKNLLDLMKNPPIQKSEPIDPDKYFLLSLLPEFRKMTENQKFELKIQIMQSVKNILSPPPPTLSIEYFKQEPYDNENSHHTV